MTNPNDKLQELFVEFDDVYGGSTSYSLDYFPVICDDVLELCEEPENYD
jgi:hypothetical protein